MNEHRLRALGYEVRQSPPGAVINATYWVLDTPAAKDAYASHNAESLWQVARKLERARMIA